ncbi:MAG: HEAT repeat domain-containing protein [Pseudomonadota bacterium]
MKALILRSGYFFVMISLLMFISLVNASQPMLDSTNAPERALRAKQIAMTGVYEIGEIDLLVGCLGDYTRLIPSNVSLPSGTLLSRDSRETSPIDEAEKALVRIGKPSVPSLIMALKEGKYGKPGGHNTFRAAKVLGDMRESTALTRLKQLAEAGDYGHQNETGADDEIPKAIAKIGKKDEYDFLLKILAMAERENRVNSGLLEAIGFTEDERSVSVLERYLKNGDKWRQVKVIKALGHTKSAEAIPLLLPYINSDDPFLKDGSRKALKELGRSDLVPK